MSGIFPALKTAIRNGTYKALQEFFPDKATAPIIFSHNNGPEPTTNYVVINIVDVISPGRGSSSSRVGISSAGTFEFKTVGYYEVRVQFSFCGSDSADMAHTFNHRISNSQFVLDEFRLNKLGYMRKSSMRRAPQKRETEWVEYQNIDVTFSYSVISTDVVDIIESVVIEDASLTPSTVFTVPKGVVIP